MAAVKRNSKIVELLIHKVADLNAKDKWDMTPFTNGADVNAMSAIEKNVGGNTPLDNALIGSHHEIADLLRKNGAKTAEELKAKWKRIINKF